MNQLAVGNAIIASCRADALNPQGAIIALADPAVTVGVSQRTVHRFFCGPIEFSLREEKSLRVFQQFLSTRAAFCPTFNSRHSLLSYCAAPRRIHENLVR